MSVSRMHVLSQVLGWAYFALWSLSFYPQVIHNYRRRSTDGFSFDFALLNVLGLTAYVTFNGCLLFSSTIRAQYARRHFLSPVPTVQSNDFVYALHGSIICCLICSHFLCVQLWNFKSKPQAASKFTFVVVGGCLAVVALDVAWVFLSIEPSREWIDVAYTVGMIKVVLTTIKYTPQALMNYRRQSTAGFSIWAILLDLSGGALSLAQLALDASLQEDWSGITGNASKFMLGNVTVIFDMVFIYQHYWLYYSVCSAENAIPSERDPLLESRNGV